MTKSTSGGCDQFETSPEANDQELRTAFCERRQTDRLKTNYRIDYPFIDSYNMYITPISAMKTLHTSFDGNRTASRTTLT